MLQLAAVTPVSPGSLILEVNIPGDAGSLGTWAEVTGKTVHQACAQALCTLVSSLPEPVCVCDLQGVLLFTALTLLSPQPTSSAV